MFSQSHNGGQTLAATSATARGEVVGIGIDMVDVEEVRRNIDSMGDKYLRRVFTEAELASTQGHGDPARHLATLFAAKEATLKALHTEGAQPPWTSMEVLGRCGQSCEVYLRGPAAALADGNGVKMVTVSTTCDEGKAAAVAVATGPA